MSSKPLQGDTVGSIELGSDSPQAHACSISESLRTSNYSRHCSIWSTEDKESCRWFAVVHWVIGWAAEDRRLVDWKTVPFPSDILWVRSWWEAVTMLDCEIQFAVGRDVEILATWNFDGLLFG
jgi:hypothetical protein